MPRRTATTRRFVGAGLAWLLLSGFSGPLWADTWIETHDEPATTWRLDTSEGARQLANERVRVTGPRKGEQIGAERIAYVAAPAPAVLAWRTTPAAAVIDELVLELEGRTALPGARLVAEVTVPNHGEDNAVPVRLRVRSEPAPGTADGDFTLRLDRFPRRVEREARVWRVANRGGRLDTRGAYVSRVAIALPGSGRPAQVWLRTLRMETVVTPLRRSDDGLTAPTAEASETTPSPPEAGGRMQPTVVTLRGDGFRVNGEPYFPRVWQWRGEPFSTLADHGVTTVWIDTLPTPQQLASAAHHRLRLLCPPPKDLAELAVLGSLDRVLAWVLPGERTQRDLDTGLVEVEAARALGRDLERPILAHVTGGVGPWSRVADGLIVERRVSRLRCEDDSAALLLAPSVPALSLLPLDVGQRLTAQLDALLGDGVATTWLPPQEVSRGVHAALRDGALGLVFAADQRLDGADDTTLATARWLEAVNRRLGLIEPWVTAPRMSGSSEAANSPLLFDRRNVRLLARDGLSTPTTEPHLNAEAMTRVVRITPAGLHSWSPPAAGTLSPIGVRAGDLLISQDPRVARSLKQYTAPTALKAAGNLTQLANQSLGACQALDTTGRQRAGGFLAEARLAISRRDAVAAYDAAHSALALVADAQTARLALAAGDLLQSAPLAVLPGTLTDHFRMEQLMAASQRGPNRLAAGSFEDIDTLRQNGWRHPPEGNRGGTVELAEADAVHGERVVRLQGESPTATARIVSPAIELNAGETVEITGWVRVNATDGGARVVIGDTLGGPELDLMIGETGTEWTPFRLVRAAGPTDVESILSFRIRGRATAEIDAVMVRAIEPLGVARRPARTATKPQPSSPR